MRLQVLALLALAPGAPAADAPTAERVAEVRASLDAAVASDDVERIVAALAEAQDVPHREVVEDVVERVGDAREGVRIAAVSCLRWLEHEDALAALETLAKDGKRMRAPRFAEAVLRGLGQHADPGSVVLLARRPFEPPDHACIRARILSLGRIRTVESLEALLGMLGALRGPRGERRVQGHMEDVRLALMLLTGVDRGREPELWERWWRENRRGFRVPEEPPLLPGDLLRRWDRYWGRPTVYAREERREDRGGDDPRR